MTHVFTSHERHAIQRALEDRLDELEASRSNLLDNSVEVMADDLISATKSALKGILNVDSLVAENRKDDNHESSKIGRTCTAKPPLKPSAAVSKSRSEHSSFF